MLVHFKASFKYNTIVELASLKDPEQLTKA